MSFDATGVHGAAAIETIGRTCGVAHRDRCLPDDQTPRRSSSANA